MMFSFNNAADGGRISGFFLLLFFVLQRVRIYNKRDSVLNVVTN